MRRQQIHYSGTKINNDVIDKIKLIAKSRYDKVIYDKYFDDINNLSDLCSAYDTSEDEENIVLGEDWFIAYSVDDYKIEILEWVAINKVENKIGQVKEMLDVFKEILLLSNQKYISAFMRHDTSYKFYLTFLNKGYLKEYYNEAIIDFCRPYEMSVIIENLKKKYITIEEYFNDESAKSYPEYEKYILHNINFGTTKKFIKKYM